MTAADSLSDFQTCHGRRN